MVKPIRLRTRWGAASQMGSLSTRSGAGTYLVGAEDIIFRPLGPLRGSNTLRQLLKF